MVFVPCLKLKTMKILFLGLLIFCRISSLLAQDTIKVSLELSKISSEISGISAPILYKNDFENYTGMEYTLDSLWIGRIILNREQYWFDQSKLKDSLYDYYLKQIAAYKIDTINLSASPVKTYVSVLVKVKNGRKVIIVDSNNNHDFSDDDVSIYTFKTDKLFYENYENINVSKVRYQKLDSNIVKDYFLEIKVKPYDKDYNYGNKIDSVKAVYFKPVNFFRGKFTVENDNLEVQIARNRMIGFKNDPNDYEYSITPVNQRAKSYDWVRFKQKIKVNNTILEITDFQADKQIVTISKRPASDSDFGWNVGDYLPEDIQGEYFSDNFKRKKYNILNFWGSWCYPCLLEIPDLKQLYKNNTELINLVNISCESKQEGISKAKEIIIKEKIAWKQIYSLLNEKDALSKLLNVNSFPTLIVVDDRGMIIARESGLGNIDTIKEKLNLK